MSHHVIRNAGVGTLASQVPECKLCDMDTEQQLQYWSKLLDLKYSNATEANNLRNILTVLTKNACETNLLVKGLQTQIADLQKQIGEARDGNSATGGSNLLQHTYE